jgi:hypothetical protein
MGIKQLTELGYCNEETSGVPVTSLFPSHNIPLSDVNSETGCNLEHFNVVQTKTLWLPTETGHEEEHWFGLQHQLTKVG